MASPRRIGLLELLAQGERSVEALARASDLGVTTTSAHLQVLRVAPIPNPIAAISGRRVTHSDARKA